MKKNLAGTALIMLALLACASTRLFAGTNGLQAAGRAALAADISLSAFVKKVIAAAPDEFALLKGSGDELGKTNHEMFKGTLTPDALSACTLYTRRGRKMELPPLYSCRLGPSRTLADATPVYEKAAADLRAAFPTWKFAEKKTGDESKREESWTLTAEQPGFTVELNLFDWGRVADIFNKTPSSEPGVSVDLSVTDTLPEKEMPKSAAAQEMTASLPICKFIEKLRAAQQNDYAALRSAKPADASGAYSGTLRPDTQTACKVYPPKTAGGNQARYSCEMRRTKTMAEIKPEYERLKTELQACYSNLKFTEDINDSTETLDEIWYFSGESPRVQITLQARDDAYMLKTGPEKVDAATKQAPVLLTLQVQFLQ